MLNGDKAVSHNYSHYAPLLIPHTDAKVTLPPIASYVSLTENNLQLLNQQNQAPARAGSELTPSLTLDSLRLFSLSVLVRQLPLSLPRFVVEKESSVPGGFPVNDSGSKKRRQRLGPSCDACRSRKVKCNAEVVLLTRRFTPQDPEIEELATLSPEESERLAAGEIVQLPGLYRLIVFNSKLIKFRQCLLCALKNLDCCFSKGFTKEDIVHTKRSGELALALPKPASSPVRVAKKKVDTVALNGARKSSCSACRKRKVKCVMNSPLSRCVGCIKKGSECSIELLG